jgi:predicted nucleotide-binding protein
MNYTVFYSWQSDLDNKLNRNFIHDALQKATKTASRLEDFSLEAVVDRDTNGIPGSPSIVESITGKIAKSDVFVCDISIINPSSDGRLVPNPNVLFELGFASAILGWERIIMVQNTAFGGPEMLPFDLRGRRILQYRLDESLDSKASTKQELKNQLISTFENALKYYSAQILGSKEKPIWWVIGKLKKK